MLTRPFQWNPEERALLDYLNARIRNKKDAMITLSDSEIQLQMNIAEEDMFRKLFRPKMRLVAAGIITLHTDANGRPVIELLQPERPAISSKRYLMVVIHAEDLKDIQRVVKTNRLKRAQDGGVAAKPALPRQPQKPGARPNYAERQQNGVKRMGGTFAPVPPAPVRPPMLRKP